LWKNYFMDFINFSKAVFSIQNSSAPRTSVAAAARVWAVAAIG
jgi:hypothetical protein